MKKYQPTLKHGFVFAAICALALAALVHTLVQKSTSASALSRAARISVSVVIKFGKPPECKGFGICQITLGGSVNKQALKGELSLEDDGKLAIKVAEKAPDEQPTIVVTKDLDLSPDIARKLGLKSATIQQGSYSFNGGRAVFNARLAK